MTNQPKRQRNFTTMSVRKDLLEKLKVIMAEQPRNITISDYIEKLIDKQS